MIPAGLGALGSQRPGGSRRRRARKRFGERRKSKELSVANDPNKRPFAFTMRWGLMAVAAIALIVVVVVAILLAI